MQSYVGYVGGEQQHGTFLNKQGSKKDCLSLYENFSPRAFDLARR